MDWRTLGDIGAFLSAVVAIVVLWRSSSTRGFDLRMKPFADSHKHLDDCLDRLAKTTEEFQEEVREEFQSLARQVAGVQVNVAERYASKADLENRIKDVRHEIDLAGRIDRLAQRAG